MRIFILLACMISALLATERLAIVANRDFPLSQLDEHQVKQIFLKKTRYIDGIRLLAINLSAEDRYRKMFEHDIMRMSTSQLRKHWTKIHYQGKRPPLVQHSIESVIAFLRQVDGAIAYLPLSKVPKDLKTLYKVKR